MSNTMIVMTKGKEVKLYKSIRSCCRRNPDFSYSYMKGLKLPFEYKGYSFTKNKIT